MTNNTKKFTLAIFAFVFSSNIHSLDLVCDGVKTTEMRGSEIPGTYSENYETFKNLIPDQNQTYMDGETRVSIKWGDSQVIIEHENTWFAINAGREYTTTYIISRKDFSWAGMTLYEDLEYMKGVCKIWEKPKDNAF